MESPKAIADRFWGERRHTLLLLRMAQSARLCCRTRKKRMQRYNFFLTFANKSAIIFKIVQPSCQTIAAGWSFSRILM